MKLHVIFNETLIWPEDVGCAGEDGYSCHSKYIGSYDNIDLANEAICNMVSDLADNYTDGFDEYEHDEVYDEFMGSYSVNQYDSTKEYQKHSSLSYSDDSTIFEYTWYILKVE